MSRIEDYCYEVFDSVMNESWNTYEEELLKSVRGWLEEERPNLSGWDEDIDKSSDIHKKLGWLVQSFMGNNEESLERIYCESVRYKLQDVDFRTSILEEAGAIKALNVARGYASHGMSNENYLIEIAAMVVSEEYSYGFDDYLHSFVNYILESDEWSDMVRDNSAKYFDVKILRYGQELAEFTKIKALSEEEAQNQAFLGLEMQLSTKVTVSEDW